MEPSHEPIPNVASKHILILEDNTELREVLTLACTQKGFIVDTAASYEEGLVKLAAQKPDVLLCDIMMPGTKTGMDFAKEVRANPETKDILVAMMTDSANMNYIADAAMANITLYFQKADTDPFKIADQIALKLGAQ
jgi:CheY-like chemotaxis protein